MFLQAGPYLYRGPQPLFEDLELLTGRGVRHVVNLRAESADSQVFCKRLQLGYTHLPVADWGVPDAEQVQRFLDILAGRENHRVLVHCFMGIGRTSLFVSCFRIFLGMDPYEAISVADQETPGNGMNEKQRDWVVDFGRKRLSLA